MKRKTFIQQLNSLINKQETILDLGCGDKILANYLNGKITTLDIWENFKPDIVWDLNKIPLPFEDNSFDVVLLIDVIEHLDKKNGMLLLEEVKRITKNKIFIFTPLFWTTNHKNVEDINSAYYQNNYNYHKSLWTISDLKGWIRIKNVKIDKKVYFGVWFKNQGKK